MTIPILEKDRKYLEETGVENVRIALLTNTHLALADRGAAWRWLKERDDESYKRRNTFDRVIFWLTLVGTVAAIIAAITGIIAILPTRQG